MTYQEKNIIVSLLTAILVFAGYIYYLVGQYQVGAFAGPDASTLVGQITLKMIGISIVISIIVAILFSIVNAIITNESGHEAKDERDRMIDLKGMQVTLVAFSIGFMLCMLGLAMSVAPYLIFILITASMFIGAVVGDVAKLVLYRRGF